MAQQPRDISYPTSAPPTGMSHRHAHGFRQMLSAVAEALSAHPTGVRNASKTGASDRLRSAANSPTSGWAELLLRR